MKINAADYSSNNATPEQIRELISDDSKRGEFMILEKNDNDFVQIAGEVASNGFILEYRDGGKQYRCTRSVSKSEAERSFLDYLDGLDSWKSRFTWEPVESSQSSGRIAIVVIVVILAILACFAFRFFSR